MGRKWEVVTGNREFGEFGEFLGLELGRGNDKCGKEVLRGLEWGAVGGRIMVNG